MGALSALSNAARWLFSRETQEPDIIAKGIALMSTFKEHGERTDALVEQMKAAAARRDHHAQEAVKAESERTDLERQFVEEEIAQNASYDEVVQFVASLAPLPRLVTDTDAAIKEKAEAEAKAEADRIAAEEAAEAARVAEEQRIADEAAAAEAQRLAEEEAARLAAEQPAPVDPDLAIPEPPAETPADGAAEAPVEETPPAA